MKNMSLKFKMLMINLALAFSMGFVGWFFVNYFYNVTEQSSLQSYQSYGVTVSDSIAAQFYERYGDVQAFAINPNVLSQDKNKAIDTLNNYAALYGIYDLILVVDKDGQLIGVNNKNPAGEAIKTESLYKKNYASEPWFQKVMKGELTEDKSKSFEGTYVEDFQVDPLVSEVFGSKRFGNSFSAPIKDSQGKTIAVVSNRAGSRWMELGITDFYLKLAEIGLAKSEITILNKDGVIIVDYDPSENKGNKEVVHDFDSTLLKLNLKETQNPAALKLASKEKGALYSMHERKHSEQATGIAPVSGIKFIDSIGWGVMVRTPKDELLASSNRVMFIFYSFMAVILVFSVLISTWFSGTLAKMLQSLAEKLQSNSVQLNSVADQFTNSSAQLSESTSSQAAALQETVASTDEVSAMVKKNSDNALESQSYSEQSQSAVNKGKETVTQMIGSIDEISQSNSDIMQQIAKSNEELTSIIKVINEIATKTKVINDIVFQTKLLSFNASVEAARAGEQGKGFAVVAEEVGNLATMSGTAAKEITDMLDASVKHVADVVERTKQSVDASIKKGREKIDEGTATAQKCGAVFDEIVANVNQVSRMVKEIALASKEQSEGVAQITIAMNKLDAITHENAAAAKESAVGAQNLRNEADHLQNAVNELLQTIEGHKKASQNFSSQDLGVIAVAREAA